MGEATVIILHPGADGEGPLTRLLAEARDRLVAHQARLFEHAGVHVVRIERGAREASFGERLVALAGGVPGGLIILGAGAVPRLSPADVRRLVAVAGGGAPRGVAGAGRRSAAGAARLRPSLVTDVGLVGAPRRVPSPLPGRGARPPHGGSRATPAARHVGAAAGRSRSRGPGRCRGRAGRRRRPRLAGAPRRSPRRRRAPLARRRGPLRLGPPAGRRRRRSVVARAHGLGGSGGRAGPPRRSLARGTRAALAAPLGSGHGPFPWGIATHRAACPRRFGRREAS